MQNASKWCKHFLIQTFLLLLGLLSPAIVHAQQAGTTLSASKTAEGYDNIVTTYDWSVDKSATPSSVEVLPNGTKQVTYTITATKQQVSQVEELGVKGQICVTNGGDQATEGLQIVDQVQYKVGAGQFQDLPGASQTLTPAQLQAEESHCYDYDFTFTPVNGALYRNTAQATITNHSGHLPGGNLCEGPDVCPFGPDVKADFEIPAVPTNVYVDPEADLTDSLSCPAGFTCTPSVTWPMHLTASQVITYTVAVHNDSATCGVTTTLHNTVTLTESTSGQQRTDSADVSLDPGACVPPPVDGGACTRTIGYWKTHAGYGPQADALSQYLPQWLGTANVGKSINVNTKKKAVDLLSMNVYGTASNGITKLYAQLLGAKLNIAAGASNTAVSSALAAADTFLATKDWNDWKNLSSPSKQMVLGWASTFDSYNNGLLGVNHCN